MPTNVPLEIPCSKCKGPREKVTHRYCRPCTNAYMRERTAQKKNGYDSLNEEGKKRWKARAYLNSYVKRGKVHKPDSCSKCGSDDRIHGHHDDYDKPLDVVWLCHTCHMAIHHS